jgi:hypothetical protein
MTPRRGRTLAYRERQRLVAERAERRVLAELERKQASWLDYLLAGIRHG